VLTPQAVVLAVIGFLLGPSLHHLGVRAAVREPFDGPLARCEHCAAVRRFPFGLRCGVCGEPIRRREPAIWLLAGASMGLTTATVGWNWLLPAHLVFVAMTTVLVVTDLDAKLLPNRVLYPGTVVVFALLAAGALAEDMLTSFRNGVLAGVVYFGLLFVIGALNPRGMGFGDVKMAFVVGLVLGFWDWRVLAQALILTGLIGGVPALFLLAFKKVGKDYEIPYGPAMILGAWIALWLGA
jgi:leader peptidase (prepilin peptidase)/N-methyltransferase